jgi:hypothetical protein
MTVLDVREAPQAAPQSTGDDTVHEICCVDDDLAMCGEDVSGDEFADGGAPPNCIVCADLIKTWAYYADHFGEDPHRPGDVPCRACPKRRREADR